MTSSVPDLSQAPCLEELLQVGFLSTETTETTETSVPNGDNGDEYRSTRASHLGDRIPIPQMGCPAWGAGRSLGDCVPPAELAERLSIPSRDCPLRVPGPKP